MGPPYLVWGRLKHIENILYLQRPCNHYSMKIYSCLSTFFFWSPPDSRHEVQLPHRFGGKIQQLCDLAAKDGHNMTRERGCQRESTRAIVSLKNRCKGEKPHSFTIYIANCATGPNSCFQRNLSFRTWQVELGLHVPMLISTRIQSISVQEDASTCRQHSDF